MLESVIDEVLKKDTQTRRVFLGVYARDELPEDLSYPCCLVFNTQPRSQRGQHWLAIFYDKNGNCDFFDSFAMPAANYSLVPYLERTSNTWVENKKRILGNSQYCGHYAILFLIFRVRSNSVKFFQAFSSNYSNNDKIIKTLIDKY